MQEILLFKDWSGIIRVILVGTLAYLAMILLLRVSGKRTLSKLNAFDLIVTVALGSTLANVLLSKDVALAEGITGFALLIGLQFLLTWLSARSKRIEQLVKAEPSLLYFRGRMLHRELCRERVTEEEIHAAARSQGLAGLDETTAVVLETDGSLTVIQGEMPGDSSTLQYLHNYPQKERS